MTSSNKDGWPQSTAPPPPPPPSGPLHPSPFYSSSQSSPHVLPAISNFTQSSPRQAQVHPHQQPPPGPPLHQPAPQAPPYSLPALNHAMQHDAQQNPAHLDREREMREREIRDRDIAERQRQHEDAARREREHRDREQAEQQQHQEPAQNHAGSLPIHQPVASKVGTTIHGPGGLLSGIGAGAGSGPSAALGAASGPSNVFGSTMQPGDMGSRSLQQMSIHASQSQPQVMQFGGNPGMHHMAAGAVPGLPQGQQPILNDALSYLDQVKVQFVDQPDVYNRFLDIMKDFKSQAIDTPGVIDRVSTLFAGHPTLIQGFNTFLPPGYRIECGTGDDPNAIRVTTPMGTTLSSMTTGFRPPSQPANGVHGANNAGARQPAYYEHTPRAAGGNWQTQGSTSGGGSENIYSPSGRPVGPHAFAVQNGQGGPQSDSQAQRDQQVAASNAAAIAQHQLEQRSVSQLRNAATAAANSNAGREGMMHGSTASGQGQAMGNGVTYMNGAAQGLGPGGQAGMEKRGPVEFNHAISYVNKIKNRFASQPEIYKQFLEILQTYQRESKPIQDVYAQVTHLFNSAPDLLEDFKQFLPETAAQAKKQEAAKQAAEDAVMSNTRGESGYTAGSLSTASAQQTPGPHRSDMKMPPVGNFAPPPSTGKEGKKRRPGAASQTAGTPTSTPAAMSVADVGQAAQAGRGGIPQPANANKRTKLHHGKLPQPDAPIVSPTLTPALPEPIAPTTTAGATTEEIAFFDRVKKFIGNKQTMNEFLKLCNLFSQDLIDKNVLVNKVSSFIGANPELMTWFKRFVGYDGKDQVIENKPRPATGRITLSTCRGYGPSYRLLPKRERLKTCSGRDEMCYQVLNDEWASHPTWASEDSGFVAHRKNMFEEALHRIEEERHDYDYNIEANARTIQLLEPIAQQIALMSEEERNHFTLPPSIGGQSTAIYKRVIKKLYDKEFGPRIVEDLYARPCAVIPVLLARLKQKDEQWKAGQREWEKVWQEQTQKIFWKSLDHMGINAKAMDKKQFTQKTLVNEIQTKLEEQKRQRALPHGLLPRYQFEYVFEDSDVVIDATRLLLVFIEHSNNHHTADRQKLEMFVKEFVPKFFGLSLDRFLEGTNNVSRNPSLNEDRDDAGVIPAELPAPRSTRMVASKSTDLRRGVLERAAPGKASRGDNENGAVVDSEESTPDVVPAMDEDVLGTTDEAMDDEAILNPTDDNWVQHPTAGTARDTAPLAREIPRHEPFRRDNFSLYCNASVYCFLRMFQILYERLVMVKQSEPEVAELMRRAKLMKPATDLRLVDKRPEDMFRDTSGGASYYEQVLQMCQDVLEQQMDINQFEDVLRRFCLQRGWQLYALEKLLGSMTRYALLVVSSEVKDKSGDIVQLFYKDRDRKETTHQNEINYRKQVEKLIREGDVFRIVFHEPSARTTMQILGRDDSTFDDATMSPEAKWSYYTASYIKIEPTEGVPLDRGLYMPFLRRNVGKEADDSEETDRAKGLLYENELEMRICVNTYKILWEPHTSDWFVHKAKEPGSGEGEGIDMDRVKEKRNKKFEEKFITSNAWMQSLNPAEVEKTKEEYQQWVAEGSAEDKSGVSNAGADTDREMLDA
ncbi:MAG: Transcriptional regulatory protein sin3 [Caeruleum heppii]|nr:MAG: Transcriptional regulatory protein sin3 [Caeruleum heppii]